MSDAQVKNIPNNHQKGRSGEAFVVAELNRRGYYATPFAGNIPSIDIMAMNQSLNKASFIQVKTKTNPHGWHIGKGIEKQIRGRHFVILVDLDVRKEHPRFFIFKRYVLRQRVMQVYRDYISHSRKDGNKRKPTDMRWIDYMNFIQADKKKENNWGILGLS